MNSRRLRVMGWLGALATAWLALGGCLDKTGDTGGETHWQKGWLSACAVDDDCAPGLECLAHLCTIRCDDDASCEGLDDASCRDLGEAKACALALCGDSLVDPGEQCDDGNLFGGDGCTTDCRNESPDVQPPDVQPPADASPTCGDAVVDAGEQCDDGNLIAGDGCTGGCRLEHATALPSCGDAVVDVGEECDDGNVVGGDGCSVTCTLEN